MDKFTLHRMSPAELDQVQSIAASYTVNPWTNRMFLDEMVSPLGHCFIIRANEDARGPVVGFLCFRVIGEESELLNLCVHPQYRKRGIGRELMNFYVRFCKRANVKIYHLEVESSNQWAVHLYLQFGYQATGMRKNLYQGKFDALLMRREE